MLTKRELVDLVIEGKAGGISPDYKKYHPNVIARYVDMALSQVMAAEIKEELDSGRFGIDSNWVKVFQGRQGPKIKWDGIREQCYINLPAKLIGLGQMRGLMQVAWPQGQDMPFRIIPMSAYSVLSNLETGILPEGVYFAQIEGDRIYFPDMAERFVGKRLTVKMISGSDGYAMDEELPIPDARTAEMLNLVMNLLAEQKQTPQKMANDSNPNTV